MSRNSASRAAFELVLDEVIVRHLHSGINWNGTTYVTMTTPLALTHSMMTWAGVACMRSPILATTASTGPPGQAVIDLYPPISIRPADTRSQRTLNCCSLQ